MGACLESGDAEASLRAEMDRDKPGVVPLSLRCFNGLYVAAAGVTFALDAS